MCKARAPADIKEQRITAAIEALTQRKLDQKPSLREIAAQYAVPYTTLSDRWAPHKQKLETVWKAEADTKQLHAQQTDCSQTVHESLRRSLRTRQAQPEQLAAQQQILESLHAQVQQQQAAHSSQTPDLLLEPQPTEADRAEALAAAEAEVAATEAAVRKQQQNPKCKQTGRAFSNQEEQALADALAKYASCGISLTVSQFSCLCLNLLLLGPDKNRRVLKWVQRGKVTHKFVKGFLKRHPGLSIRFSDRLDHKRAAVGYDDLFSLYRKMAEVQQSEQQQERGRESSSKDRSSSPEKGSS